MQVFVERGHLIVKDGIAHLRREARFPRVRHGLRRLVVIGSDGMVSFAALRSLADQGAAFVMLDRDGSVLLATGPVGPKDARLRRLQALAHHNGIAVSIARELIAAESTEALPTPGKAVQLSVDVSCSAVRPSLRLDA